MCRVFTISFDLFSPAWDIKIRNFSGAACQNMSKSEILLEHVIVI